MRRFALLAAALVMAAGCQTDSTSPTVSVVGTYHLQTINGQRLPYAFQDNSGNFISLQQDILTMRADGTYSDVAYLSDNSTSEETGTYSALNGSIQFFDDYNGEQYGGSLSGSVLTEISENGALIEVFQR
jgi:hypothetical protein